MTTIEEHTDGLESKMAADEVFTTYIDDVADRAGLFPVMGAAGVLGVVRDRGNVADRTLLGLRPDDVQALYDTFVGPAVDRLEQWLLDTERMRGSSDETEAVL